MLVYLAHPIDQAANGGGIANITDLLDSLSVSYYRPGAAFRVSNVPLSDLNIVDRINCSALAAADALVAWLPRGVATLGVPSEIESALYQNKPVVILTNQGLSLDSVQMASWRGRGAHISEFSHQQSLLWQAQPVNFIDMLRTPPAANADHEIVYPTFPPDLRYTLAEGARPLTRGHSDDAGLDLAVLGDERLSPGERRMLRTGVKAAVPHGHWGLIIGRSSTLIKHGCEVKLGVIDAGYRGELMIQLENQTEKEITFEAGTRLAQYVLLPAWLGSAVETAELPEHERGENGYGSTGQ